MQGKKGLTKVKCSISISKKKLELQDKIQRRIS